MGKPARRARERTTRSRPRRDRGRVDPVTRALVEIFGHIEIEAAAACLLRNLVEICRAGAGRLYLRDPRHGRWRRSADLVTPGGQTLPFGPLQRLVTRCRTDPAATCSEVAVPPEWNHCGVRGLALIPIRRNGEPIGIAAIWKSGTAKRWRPHGLRTAAKLAIRAIPAIDNAWTVRRYRDLVIKDDQTESYNRRHLEPVLLEETERANRYGTPLSLIFLDLDDLKQVNNRYGHLMGSQALRELCLRLIGSIRRFDKMFRFGGDEFCILLPQTGVEGATELAERLRRAVADAPFLVSETGGLRLTASFGIASFPTHARSSQDLVQRADLAMRGVKKERKNALGIAAPLTGPEDALPRRQGLGR
jgi:diguanylate cyclase (GGDEF)-like protein